MSKTIYTQEQLEILKRNKYVKACTPKYITFTDDCRITAIQLHEQGWYFRDIFRHFGFPDFIVDSDVPKNSLKDWRKRIRSHGITGLVHSKKGRKLKEKIDTSQMTKDEYITYLEAKTAYLEELQRRMHGHDP